MRCSKLAWVIVVLILIGRTTFGEPSLPYIQKNSVIVKDEKILPSKVLEYIRDYKVISIGEVHGTTESPAFVSGMLQLLAQTGKSILLGVEIPATEQENIDKFLLSGDPSFLKATPFFQRPYQDGRSSKAMAQLLNDLRPLKHVRVFAFDVATAMSGQERDEKMARNLSNAYKAAPSDYVVFLAGNIHSGISVGVPFDPKYRPMGYELIHQSGAQFSQGEFLPVKIRNEKGEAWCCLGALPSDCKVQPMGFGPSNYSTAIQADAYFLMEEKLFEGYEATFFLRHVTASIPFKTALLFP